MMLCEKSPKLVQGVDFELTDLIKNYKKVCKVFFIFWYFGNSWEKICNSKASVGIATAMRHRGLNKKYIRLNLFDQIKLGRGIELQHTHTRTHTHTHTHTHTLTHTTHTVIFKSPRDVMQISTLSAQRGLGSKLVERHGDATAAPYRHLLVVTTDGSRNIKLYKRWI